MEKKLFTSESVTEGHPDKVCDQISDAILDALMEKDPNSRVACETCCTTGLVMVMGEVTTNAYVDIQKIVRDTVKEIGYDSADAGFNGNTCAVIGRYLVTTDDENDYFLQVQQRCTFIWEIQKGSPKIIHIHVSNPIGELKIAKGERFVNTVGYMANHYLQENFKRRFSGKQITVTDSRGALRLIYLPEIMYVRAQRNDLILVLATEEVQVKMKISEFMQLADQKFLQVHRSYAVNTDYMALLERYEISMKNGDRIPVPVKKYNEVRDEMIRRHNAAQSDQSDGVVE